MAEPASLPTFENSFHALRRFKMPSFLGAHRSGLTKEASSRLNAAYPAFYTRQDARRQLEPILWVGTQPYIAIRPELREEP